MNSTDIARARQRDLENDHGADRELTLLGSEDELDTSPHAVAPRLEVDELGVLELPPVGCNIGRHEFA